MEIGLWLHFACLRYSQYLEDFVITVWFQAISKSLQFNKTKLSAFWSILSNYSILKHILHVFWLFSDFNISVCDLFDTQPRSWDLLHECFRRETQYCMIELQLVVWHVQRVNVVWSKLNLEPGALKSSINQVLYWNVQPFNNPILAFLCSICCALLSFAFEDFHW